MEKKGKIHYAWWIMVVMFLFYFTIQASTMQVMGLYTKPVSEEFDVPRSVYLLHNVFLNLGGLVASPILGKLYKKFKFHWVMTVCIILNASGFFLRSIATNIYVIIALGFFRGLFFIGTTMLPVGLLMTSWFEQKRGFASSTITVAAAVGGIFLNPIIQQMITNKGWRAADQLLALIVLLMAPVAFLLIRGAPKDKGLRPYGYDPATAAANKGTAQAVGMTFREARSTPSFYILLFVAFATTFIGGAMIQLSPFLTDSGWDPLDAAKMISLIGFLGIFGRPLMGLIHDKFKPSIAATIFFTTAATAFICITNVQNKSILLVGIVLYSFNSAISLIMPPLWTSAIFGTKDYAAIFSWVIAMTRFGSMAGGFLIGLLHDITGNNNLIWPICSALMLLSLAGILYCLRHANKSEAAPAAVKTT